MSLVPPFLLLDRYDVTDEIGHGGHAVVYRAHDRVLDREVAVKLLRDDALSPDTIARFRQEVQVTAQLEHAHILHVYDTGAHEGRPYIVMELATGRTLAERLAREGQLPVVDALQVVRDVGLALAHAHARGVVHRDVKPENILLGEGGAILADFGIARVTQDILTQKITSTGTAVGTVQYMSPEQLCAEPNIDARSDQYSLACVLYEMLAGVRPHIAATFEGLRMLRMTGRHVPVSAHRPSVPEYVDDAIATALAPMPADRFRTMDELLAAIGVGASGEFVGSGGSGAARGSGGYAGIGSGGARRSGGSSGSGGRGVAAIGGISGAVAGESWWTRRKVATLATGVVVVATSAAVVAANMEGSSSTSTGDTRGPGIPVRVEVVDVASNAGAPARAEAAIAEVRQYLELVPTVTTHLSDDTLAKSPRYVVRVRQSANDTVSAAFEISDAVSGKVLFRSSREQDVHTGPSFWSKSGLSALRTLAVQDEAFPAAYRAVLSSSESPEVVRRLIVGWKAFAVGDDKGAERSFREALELDGASGLARSRLAAVLANTLRFEEAYDVASTNGLTDGGGLDPARNTVLGYRHFAARQADSALAAFRRSVADHPENSDGWFGLAITHYFQGWVAGSSVVDAAEPFRQLLALEPGFSRVREQQFDAALAASDTAAARDALAAIPPNDRWRVAKQAIFDAVTSPADSVSRVVEAFRDKPAQLITEAVLQLSRTQKRPDLGRRFAELLMSPGRPRDERVRGMQFLIVLVPGDSARDHLASLDSLRGPNTFDPWRAAACLAAPCTQDTRQRLARSALLLTEGAADSVLTDHGSLASQAMDFLAQLSLIDPRAVPISALASRMRRLSQFAHPSDPLVAGWRATFLAAGAQTSAERIVALQSAAARIDAPYDAFFPLRANSIQRRVLAESREPGTDARPDLYQSSFDRSWCLADVAFGRIPRVH